MFENLTVSVSAISTAVFPHYRVAVMASGVFLITLYAHDYDLAISLLTVVALASEMILPRSRARWEKLLLLWNTSCRWRLPWWPRLPGSK
jgi:hypothetical protein